MRDLAAPTKWAYMCGTCSTNDVQKRNGCADDPPHPSRTRQRLLQQETETKDVFWVRVRVFADPPEPDTLDGEELTPL